MNLTLKPYHWIVMVIAVTLGLGAYVTLPTRMPIFEVTAFAFVIFALAVVLDTLATAVERRSGALKAAGWLCLVLAGGVALWPLSGALSAFHAIYVDWRAAGHPVFRAIQEAMQGLGPYSDEQIVAIWVAVGLATVCFGLAVGLPIAAMRAPRLEENRASVTGPWKADWMSARDIAYLKTNRTGLPLALHDGRLLRYKKADAAGWRGGHHLVVAGTRGGKGISAVVPAILDHQGPVVALDIKGENFAVTRRHRRKLGRDVAVLNPFGVIEPSRSQFNPLDYIRRDELARDVDLVADGLMRPEQGDGAHFSEMGRELIAAAIEVIVIQEVPQRRNLIAVADLLLSSNLDARLEAWVKYSDDVGHRPAQVAATILRAGDRERGSIQTSISKAFSWMQSDAMRHFLQCSTFRMDDLLDNKLDLYIVVPLDQINKQTVFMRLFVNLVLGAVVRQDGRRKVKSPILLVLDEFVRMGRMEQILNIANVAAGQGIEVLFVTQDTGQVETAYGRNDARSIFGSCITKRLFNLNDIETLEWAARHFGDSTVYSQQIREGKSATDSQDFSYSEQKQKLMYPQNISEMASDELLLFIGNRKPLKAKQNRYFDNRTYKGKWDENPLN